MAAQWSRWRKQRPRPDLDAVEAEMERAVRQEVDERLGPYLEAGTATLTIRRYEEDGSGFDVVSTNPAAAG